MERKGRSSRARWAALVAALVVAAVYAPNAAAAFGMETREYVVPARHGVVYLGSFTP